VRFQAAVGEVDRLLSSSIATSIHTRAKSRNCSRYRAFAGSSASRTYLRASIVYLALAVTSAWRGSPFTAPATLRYHSRFQVVRRSESISPTGAAALPRSVPAIQMCIRPIGVATRCPAWYGNDRYQKVTPKDFYAFRWSEPQFHRLIVGIQHPRLGEKRIRRFGTMRGRKYERRSRTGVCTDESWRMRLRSRVQLLKSYGRSRKRTP
jgi:hypothetical protein